MVPIRKIPEGTGRRILVVDDNEDAADGLALGLKLRGHHIAVAYDPVQALALAETFVPEVALLDIGLPGMDGYELARRLRQLPGLAGLRLVAVTGYGQQSDRDRSRDEGFHAHLVKPVDFDTIVKTLI